MSDNPPEQAPPAVAEQEKDEPVDVDAAEEGSARKSGDAGAADQEPPKKRSLAELEALADQRRIEREKEEAQRAVEREKQRVESQKALLKIKEEREEALRKKAIADKKAQEQSDKAAKAAIMAKIEQDKRERAARLGIPYEPAPAKSEVLPVNAPRGFYAQQVEKDEEQKQKEADENKERVVAVVALLGAGPNAKTVVAGFQRVCANLIGDPTNERFRRLPKSAKLVQQLVEADGGRELLEVRE